MGPPGTSQVRNTAQNYVIAKTATLAPSDHRRVAMIFYFFHTEPCIAVKRARLTCGSILDSAVYPTHSCVTWTLLPPDGTPWPIPATVNFMLSHSLR